MKLSTCPLCQNADLPVWFSFQNAPVARCTSCGLVMLNPQPDNKALEAIYGNMYFIGSDQDEMRNQGNTLKRGTAQLQLAEIKTYISPPDSHQLLEVGCGLGNFLIEARQAGFAVQGLDVSTSAVAAANAALGTVCVRAGHLETAGFEPASFDVIVLADVVEHVRDPKAFMDLVRTLVKPDGVVFVAVPSLDSFSARLMGRNWMEFKPEHLFYFNHKTIHHLLNDCGFHHITISPGTKVLSLGYIIGHFEKFPVPLLTPMARAIRWVLPKALLAAPFRVVASGLNVMARISTQHPKQTQSKK